MSLELATGMPSSVKPMAPASLKSPISTNCLPAWPMLIAAKTWTRTTASAAACSRTYSTTLRESMDRIGVGHGADGGEAASGRGAGSAGQVFLVLEAGHAEVGMDVHEARRDDEAAGVDNHGIAQGQLTVGRVNGSHETVFDHHVGDAVESLRWIKHAPRRG